MTRRWPTRAWGAGDGVGTAVYVGDRAAIVMSSTRVAYEPGDEADVSGPLVVIDEGSWPVRAVMEALRQRIRRGVIRVEATTPRPRRVHQRVERWQPLVGTWSWGRSPTGVYVSDGGDSTRDVWRPPPLLDAELALRVVPGCAHHRGLRELDSEAAREAAGYAPDTLERVMEVIL